MKKLLWLRLALMVFAAAVSVSAQNSAPQQTITLYAPPLYTHDFSRASVDLLRADYAKTFTYHDVVYGSLRVGDDWDWFESDAARRGRSLIVDLGKHAWTDSFTVPWVEPLKPGETLGVVVNANGADGKDGKPGFGAESGDGLSALPSGGSGTNPPACCDSPISTGTIDRGYPTQQPRRPKRPAGVQTSPNLLKANLDHIYVIHVVDDNRDFYALFRVDALQRGDHCTISWKMIPPPPQTTTVRK